MLKYVSIFSRDFEVKIANYIEIVCAADRGWNIVLTLVLEEQPVAHLYFSLFAFIGELEESSLSLGVSSNDHHHHHHHERAQSWSVAVSMRCCQRPLS